MDILWLIAPAGVSLAGLVHALTPRYHESSAERHMQRGRDRKAAWHLEAARRVWERRRGEESLEAASAVASLARIRYIQGRCDEGAALLDRAARHTFSYAGKPSRRLIVALVKLGQAVVVAERFGEASLIGEKALGLAGRLLPAADPCLAAVEAVLGDAYSGLGTFEKAHEHYGKALEFYQISLGEDAPERGAVLAAVAAAMVREERWKEAREAGLEAVDILDHSNSARLPEALGALADLHARRGRLAEAEGLRLSICHLWERIAGHDSIVLAKEYERRADLLRGMERMSEAVYLSGKAEKIRRAVAGA